MVIRGREARGGTAQGLRSELQRRPLAFLCLLCSPCLPPGAPSPLAPRSPGRGQVGSGERVSGPRPPLPGASVLCVMGAVGTLGPVPGWGLGLAKSTFLNYYFNIHDKGAGVIDQCGSRPEPWVPTWGVLILTTPFPVQLPADALSGGSSDGPRLGSLPLRWETWSRLLAPSALALASIWEVNPRVDSVSRSLCFLNKSL